MKKFEEFTKEDLVNLRSQVVLNSVFTADYANNMGISDKSAGSFFDGYYDFIWELAEEDAGEKADMLTHNYVMEHYDNPETLEEWYGCFDDFEWVEYDEE